MTMFQHTVFDEGVPPAAGLMQARRLRHKRFRPRRGVSLVEVTLVSGLTVFLAVLLSSTWALLNRPTSELIAWGQIFQEMDLATASIARDVGGGLSDYCNASVPLGNKQQGALVGCRRTNDLNGDHLQLCFDGQNPTGQAQWNPPAQTIIDYYVTSGSNTLTRWNQTPTTAAPLGTFFTVAKNVARMQVVDNGTTLTIILTFTYVPVHGSRALTRSCNLTVQKNP